MKSELKIAMGNFVNNGYKILELWDEDMDNLDHYPFDESFDEVLAKISKWIDSSNEHDKEPSYHSLDILADVYDSIIRKIKLYAETKDEGLLTEVADLEGIFNSNLEKLAYAEDVDGNVYKSKKAEYSMNAIVVGDKTFSYYHFFENYKPYSA